MIDDKKPSAAVRRHQSPPAAGEGPARAVTGSTADRPQTDTEGYLIDPALWTEAFDETVAKYEQIELTEEHWKVIRFMRSWLEEHGVSPDARHVMKFLAGDREAGRARLFELFPYGYVKQACKIAGMKRPRAWSTG
jgi:tRNA 2-thiouridine synthesizing protein E